MNALVAVKGAQRLADPIEVYGALCRSRSYRYVTGELTLHESVDYLQAAATKLALVDTIGQDAVQEIIAAVFGPIREARKRVETDQWSDSTADRNRIHPRSKAQDAHVAASTLAAAELLVRGGDANRLHEWLLAHADAERSAIVRHIDRARS
jgi:hypothetical protein